MKKPWQAIFLFLSLFFLWLLRAPFVLAAGEKAAFQNTVKIEGQVLDAETGEPLIGANVVVEGTAYGAATNRQGAFKIMSLPAGSYTVRAEMIGYASQDKLDVLVPEDGTVGLQFRLQPTLIQLGSLLVWGNREALSAWESPAALEIIPARKLRRSGAQDLGDFLKSQAGVLVYDTGGEGGQRTISIRGSHANQVLILVDGVKLNPAQNNTVDLSTLSLDWIDHIEILKSGGSTIFGSDAIGGVINIVTRKGSGTGKTFSLNGSGGSFGTREAGFFLSPRMGKFQMTASFQEREAQGNFPYRDSFGHQKIRQNNGFRDGNAFFQFSDSHLLGGEAYLSVQRFQARRGVPGALRQLTPRAWLRDGRWLFQSGWKIPVNQRALLKLTAFYQRYRQEFFSPRPWVFSPVNSLYLNEALGLQTRVQVFATSRWPLEIGEDFRVDRLRGEDRIRPRFSLGRVARRTVSTFALWRARISLPPKIFFQKMIFSPGIRGDFPSDFPSVGSPSAGIALVHEGKLRLAVKGTWGKTYRAPTFNSLFWVEDVFARGNPDLRPERGVNRDVGVKAAGNFGGHWEAEVHFFDNFVRDLVYWRRNYDGKYMPVNVSAARLSGREDALRARFFGEKLVLSWNHTRLLAVNHSGQRTTEGKILPFRPRQKESFSAQWKAGRFFGRLSYRFVSKRFTREANTKWLKPYHLWNAALGTSLKGCPLDVRFIFSVENLENTRYEVLERYPMPGREFRVKAEVKW